MPTTKLTLSAEKEIIELARSQAKREGISISAMFSNFVRAKNRKIKKSKYGPLTRQMLEIGNEASRKISKNKTDRELLEEALAEKYGVEL
jgi:L-rhamnose isomerase